MTKFWNFTPSLLQDNVLNMYVFGDIVTDSNWFTGSEDDVITREFLKDLRKHTNVNRINVYINSGGGEVFAAVCIAQQLINHKAEVHTYVTGLCASAATIISMAGDVRHMTRAGLYMIHLPSTKVTGNKFDLEKGTEILKKVEDVVVAIYMEKLLISETEVRAMIEHEKWLDAEEAKTYGFISVIEEEEVKEKKEAKEASFEKPKDLNTMIFDLSQDLFSLDGENFKISAFTEPEQLKNKLDAVKNKLLTEGGKSMLNQTFLNGLSVENQKAINDHIAEQIKEAVSANAETQAANAKLEDSLSLSMSEKKALVDELKEVTAKLEKAEQKANSLAKEAPVTNQVGAKDEEMKFLDSLPAEAKAALLDARAETVKAQAALAKIVEEGEFNEFKTEMKTYDKLPLQDKHIQNLYNMSKSCPDDFASISELLKVANVAMKQNFVQIGSEQGGEPSLNAYDAIEKAIKTLQDKENGLSYNEAFARVVTDNPNLYEDYRNNLS